MSAVQRVTGHSRLDSKIWASPDEGDFGVARNVVRISRLRVALYLLKEEYTLSRDGTGATVNARERFGPIPFLFRNSKEHPAEIHADGMSSTYYMPLLGTEWTAHYTVDPGRREIAGMLRCAWALHGADGEAVSATAEHEQRLGVLQARLEELALDLERRKDSRCVIRVYDRAAEGGPAGSQARRTPTGSSSWPRHSAAST